MRVPDELQAVAQRWMIKAERDFKVAVRLLGDGDDYLVDAICFHAQQSIEKYLKVRW